MDRIAPAAARNDLLRPYQGARRRMFAHHLRSAIEAAPRITLPAITAQLWKAFGEGHVSEAEAEALSALIEARQALRSPEPGGSTGPINPDAPQDRPRSPRTGRNGSRPRTDASLERRRRWAASGRMPPAIAARFTLAEQAVLWAHVRRKIFDVHAATGSALAAEALARIGALYGIERELHGKPPDARTRERQARAKPLAAALKLWAERSLTQLPGRSELAKALRYMLARWPALTRAFDDGRIALDNNAAERALRGVAVGRKNYLFAGSDLGAERAATFYTLIETAKLNRIDPEAYLRDVLTRIADHPAKRLADLLPWNWTPAQPAVQAA
ncbi:hypothetical protein AX289_29550 [Methylorubrum populi]|nr:hypothetical protein AX289_29550 [Methylorubrum populi]